jgi:hypothetical protein
MAFLAGDTSVRRPKQATYNHVCQLVNTLPAECLYYIRTHSVGSAVVRLAAMLRTALLAKPNVFLGSHRPGHRIPHEAMSVTWRAQARCLYGTCCNQAAHTMDMIRKRTSCRHSQLQKATLTLCSTARDERRPVGPRRLVQLNIQYVTVYHPLRGLRAQRPSQLAPALLHSTRMSYATSKPARDKIASKPPKCHHSWRDAVW